MKIRFHSTAAALFAAVGLCGCTGDGVPQEDYDSALDSARKLKMQVEDLESQLEKAKEEAENAPAPAPSSSEGNAELEKQLDEQLQELETKQKELDQLRQEFKNYKANYRLTVRDKIIDKDPIPRLATADGEVFTNVVVKEFNAVGLRIMHDGGTGRLKFEDLDKKLQDSLGYDKEEADAILATELAAKAEAQAKAVAAAEANAPTTKEKKAMSKSALERKIAQLDSWVTRANNQQRAIKRQAMDYEAKARYAKSRGRVSYWGPQAAEKNAIANALMNQIRTAQRELKDLRRQLRAAK
jgi:chromosome segregation ATPase